MTLRARISNVGKDYYAVIELPKPWTDIVNQRNHKTESAAKKAADKFAKSMGFQLSWRKNDSA
jgi:hypothetical protein